MFTGLIEGVGAVRNVSRSGADAVLTVEAPFDLAEVALGDSIAVSGACLTVTRLAGSTFSVDVSAETLSRTNLGRLGPGHKVNLERALRLGDRLGGHLVSGHIDAGAELISSQEVGASLVLAYRLAPDHLRYVIPKGSIAIDGVSLTVNRVGDDFFEVNIIPHTAAQTTLNLNKPGDVVNIETDLIGKYVERLLGPRDETREEGVSLEMLAEHGFLR